MIRLDKFDYAIVDERSQTVKVGGGTTFGTLITALHAARQVLREFLPIPYIKQIQTLT